MKIKFKKRYIFYVIALIILYLLGKQVYIINKSQNYDYFNDIQSTDVTSKPEKNQARWPAQAWLLTYIYEIDRELFNQQIDLYNKYFFDNLLWLGISRDIPKWQEQINTVPAGPMIFGYSFSATILSLSAQKVSENNLNFYETLKAVDTLFFYNGKWEYLLWNSVLIDSLALWGKCKISWGNKI